MTAITATKRRPGSVRFETGTPTALGRLRPRRVRARKVVVAVLDGGADDAEVVDVALGSCLARRRDLRLVHLYGALDEAPTPLFEAFAREYLRGAMTVARLVPTVDATAVSIPWATSDLLRPELAHAEILVASMGRSAEVVDAGRPVRSGALRCHIITVSGTRSQSGELRFAYRLALQGELERSGGRADGATTPEALDDAWHVGIACPELSADAINAWVACSAWPPRTVSNLARQR
ncbi:hypothetical protein [Pengzhenrongella frigida]|uniref:hypothetical protein n=1 Tax=Pengzhenrongella frigida TaxID=1259133 RepID=UPI0013ED0FBF|nr:hypothetical protein [Cellulomonas sp. HLT2-17]